MNVRSVVCEIVGSHTSVSDTLLDDHLTLGVDGLGLDSIAIAEVLLECEMRFGIPFGGLLDDRALTVGRLTQHLEAAIAP